MFTTGSIPPPGPLAYGGEVAVPFITRTFNPTTSNNQFPVPTLWINTATSSAFVLVSKALGIADWLAFGTFPGDISTITTPDSTVVVPTANNVNFLNGSGMNITGSGSSVTFNTVGGGLTWTVVTAASQAISNNHGYIANNGAGVAFSLPTTCPVGTLIGITSMNAGGWTISQAAGQSVRLGNQVTTTGVGGSLTSTAIGDTLLLVCNVADTSFISISAVGNITKV